MKEDVGETLAAAVGEGVGEGSTHDGTMPSAQTQLPSAPFFCSEPPLPVLCVLQKKV